MSKTFTCRFGCGTPVHKEGHSCLSCFVKDMDKKAKKEKPKKKGDKQ